MGLGDYNGIQSGVFCTPLTEMHTRGNTFGIFKAQILKQEIWELAFKGAFTPNDGSRDSYISQTFLVPKSEGSCCESY